MQNLRKILKQNSIHATIKMTDHYPYTKTKKLIELMEDELYGKIMKEVITLRPKIYIYLKDDGCANEKANVTKRYVIKQEVKF